MPDKPDNNEPLKAGERRAAPPPPPTGSGKEVSTTSSGTSATTAAAAGGISKSSYGSRALQAGGRRPGKGTAGGGSSAVANRPSSARAGSVTAYKPAASGLALGAGPARYLVVGDGLMAPFMALCLRVNGLECDLAHHPSSSDIDRGTIALTPSVTQLMGDVLNVTVPSGSVIGRVLTFDHVGNDMSDIDLNEFREKGESPTFFCCDRPKIEQALLSLCHAGMNSCNVLTQPVINRGGLEALPEGGVRVHYGSGTSQDYLGVISTARNQDLVPELTVTNEELQRREENSHKIKESLSRAVRWMEVCVPPLPELGKFEKRFTPGSQEIVEILTPRGAKLTVRPTMLATKLFYNVNMTIPDDTADPRLKSTSLKQFWDDVAMHWTAGVPGYVSHTMFRPMFSHVQENFSRSSALVYRTPLFLIPHWMEGDGRLIKIAHSAHGACFDAIDVADAQGFSDCFLVASALANRKVVDVPKFVSERRLQVLSELDYHSTLLNYGIKERGQLAYMQSRFMMKIMGRFKKSWRGILKHYTSLVK